MILALALALASSQVDYSPLVRVRDASAARVRGREGVSFAFFEFAPASGAGVGSVAPYPNWVSYSEQLDNAAWTSQFAPSAITVTANASGAMERLQIPATTGAQYALLYQNAAVVLAGPLTISADVRGVGGTSGTFKLGVFNGVLFYYGDCAFTAALTRCSVSVSFPAPTLTRIYLGNDSANIVGNPAQAAVDVYVGSVQLNVGSTTAPYIATTTAAAGYMPTGAKGEAMTFSRTGTAMATRTATGGLATTGIANGDLVVMSANQPRVEYDSAGTLGLLVESSRANNTIRSQEISNAAWTDEIFGAGATPVVTADYATAPDGTATADRVQFSATSGTDESMRYMGGACGAPCTVTYYVRGTSGSGTLDVCAGTSGCASCSFVSTSWTRCTAVGNAGASLIGNGSRYNGGVARTASDVLVWGAQSETASYATSYIPTTSAAVTRNAETAYFDLGAGSPLRAENMSMAITSVLAGLNPGIQGVLNVNAGSYGATSGADSMWAYFSSGGSVRCLASTSAATGTVALVATPARTWCSSTVSSVNGSSNGVAMSAGGAPTAGAQPARWVNVGASPFPYSNDGIFSRVCVDTSSTRCR